MLRIGLTGGIGSGKSSVARLLVAHGGVLIDSDVLAREVVAPGTPGLAAVLAAFGADLLAPDGTLDRPALGALVFVDTDARRRLGAIIHPLVRERSAALLATAPPDAIVVQDVPLLVENGMAAEFALVVVVHADADERARRLVRDRGATAEDAARRIAAQADDTARRAAADVWLPNDGPPEELAPRVAGLWTERLVPFAENVRRDRPAAPAADGTRPGPPDPDWPAAAARLAARIAAAAGPHSRGVAHIGPTARSAGGSTEAPTASAVDVLDLQLGVPDTAAVDAVRPALAAVGFPRLPGAAGVPDPTERRHASADPGRPVALTVRVIDSPAWRDALGRPVRPAPATP